MTRERLNLKQIVLLGQGEMFGEVEWRYGVEKALTSFVCLSEEAELLVINRIVIR